MAKVKLAQHMVAGSKVYEFLCPGCGKAHLVGMDERSEGMLWNRDLSAPTINFAIIISESNKTCASMVHGGKISYLGDTTAHGMVGLTVDMPDI